MNNESNELHRKELINSFPSVLLEALFYFCSPPKNLIDIMIKILNIIENSNADPDWEEAMCKIKTDGIKHFKDKLINFQSSQLDKEVFE